MKKLGLTRGLASVFALVAMTVATGVAHAEVQSPPPGSVYREFKIDIPSTSGRWRVTDPNASAGGQPGNSPSDYLPNAIFSFSIPDSALDGALSATAIVDYWGGHVGTTGQQMRFNNSPWRDLPALDNTPTDPECYTQQWNPAVEIPISDLREGANTMEGTSDRQTCYGFGWGQWGWYGVVLRVFYDPATVEHPTGFVSSPADSATIGNYPTVAVSTNGGVRSVEIFAYYDGPDADGDGHFLEYHQAYHRPKNGNPTLLTSGHVGTDYTAPYSVIWNNELVPNQTGIKFLARIEGSNGVWFVSPETTGVDLQRGADSVLQFKPFNVPERFWVRAGATRGSRVHIPESVDLSEYTWARVIIRTWNGNNSAAEPGQEASTTVNGRAITRNYGSGHHYDFDVIGIPVSWLRSGDNSITFRSESSHHGSEILWPGPEVVIGNTTLLPVDCGDGKLDLDEDCDDGNSSGGDGCEADCTLSTTVCGDGQLDPGEECDDGNNVNDDGCQSDCRLPLNPNVFPAMFPFEGDGTFIEDIANDNHGTLGAAARRSNTGRFGKAIEFLGTNGQVNLGRVNFAGPFTVAMWIKADDFGISDARLISKATGTSEQAHFFMLSTINSGKLRFRLKTTSGGTSTLIATNGGLPRGVWVHVAAVWDGATMRLYQDAVPVGTLAKGGNPTGDQGVATWVGNQPPGGGKSFDGHIDELLIADRAYSAAELVTLKDAPLSGPVDNCGNGELDPGEACDDGNDIDGDGCQADCSLPECGDGIVDPGEACDDGNAADGDGCRSDCTVQSCGDGIVDPGEACDDGNTVDGDGCQGNCALPGCGDAVLDPSEGCDDGNTVDGDGCQGNCALPICGDGIQDPGEVCDDGNTVDGDGCSGDCLTFDGPPPGANSVIVNGDFADGTNDWRFFTNANGSFDVVGGAAVLNIVSTGSNIQLYQVGVTVEGGEQYRLTFRARANRARSIGVKFQKHGSPYSNYGLNVTIDIDETMRTYEVTFTVPGGNKSDGRLMFWLAADDAPGDMITLDDVVMAPPMGCGDGTLDLGEACDDGNLAPGDGCDALCRIEACGNGRVDAGEDCDDGNTVGGDACPADCQGPECGDGTQDPGEGCDDGNTIDGDGCQSDCALPACGDGVQDAGEECDDGNTVDGDGCQAGCVLPTCGDAIVDAGEACDDGNAVDDDACSNSCDLNGPGIENVLANGDFASGTADWTFYTNGVGSFTTPGGVAQIAIGSTASNIQLYQRSVAVRGNTNYRLRFRVRNTAAADLDVRLIKHKAPYSHYGLRPTVVDVTTEWQTVTIDFRSTSGNKTDGRLMFWFKGYAVVGSDYFIDDVELFELP